MDYKPGDTVYVEICTQVFATGVATNADSLPTGTVNKNGADDGAVAVTVSNLDAGRYKAVFTIPTTYLSGDVLNLTVAATVSGVAGKAGVWHAKLGIGVIRSSTAQAGAAGTITLDAGASAVTDFYKGAWIVLVAGAGAGQARMCTAYDGVTKIATIGPNWATNPGATSIFAILPAAAVDVDTQLTASHGAGSWQQLTQTAAAALAGSLAGSTITIHRGDTLTVNFTGMGDIQNWTKLWFTLKRVAEQTDPESLIQVLLSNPGGGGDGLLYINGGAPTLAANGSLAVTDAVTGAVTLTVKPAETLKLPNEGKLYLYDVQVLRSTGVVSTLTNGQARINGDVTRIAA